MAALSIVKSTGPVSLKSMASHADAGVRKTTLWKIAPGLLQEEEGFNLRDYHDPRVSTQIEKFALAYAEGRYVLPLIVRTDDHGAFVIVEGHLRRRGALLAISRGTHLPYLECAGFRGNDADRDALMMRCADGLELTPFAKAMGCLRFHRRGLSNAEIAREVNLTVARVEQLMLLALANSDVQALVASGKVKADTAIEAVRAHGEDAGAFLQRLLDEGARPSRQSVRGTSIPPKLASTVTNAFTTLFGKRSPLLGSLARWEKGGRDKRQKIEVDAAALFALKEAHDQLAAMQDRRSERQTARARKTGQQATGGPDSATRTRSTISGTA